MKNTIKIALLSIFLMLTATLYSQEPPHPNGGFEPGGGSTPVGGAAPIDGGLSVLMLLGAAYSLKKKFKGNK